MNYDNVFGGFFGLPFFVSYRCATSNITAQRIDEKKAQPKGNFIPVAASAIQNPKVRSAEIALTIASDRKKWCMVRLDDNVSVFGEGRVGPTLIARRPIFSVASCEQNISLSTNSQLVGKPSIGPKQPESDRCPVCPLSARNAQSRREPCLTLPIELDRALLPEWLLIRTGFPRQMS